MEVLVLSPTEKFMLFLSINKRFFNIPVHMLYSVDFQHEKKNYDHTYICIETKDFRMIKFIITGHNRGKDLFNEIRKVAFPNILWKDVFPLKYKYTLKTISRESLNKLDLPSNGWEVYDMQKEFKRQGVKHKHKMFRIQNAWYPGDGDNIWETYPMQIYVPA